MDGSRDFSYDDAVDEIANRYGVPKSVYKKMLGQESGDNDKAVSNVGAFTAWQIMPATAKGLGYDPDELRREPLKAAEGGLRILRDNYKRFRKYAENEKHAWMMSVAGYHGNPANVLRDIRRGGYGLPDISDGAITTKQHVLKIFDGLKGETLDRSPLGTVQNNFASSQSSPESVAPAQRFVDPAKLPKVSLGDLPAEMFQPKQTDVPITLPQNLKTLNAQNSPEQLPLSNLPKPEQVVSQLPPQNIPAPQGREPLPEDYQNFLKYSELTDSPESRNLYSKTVIEPLAATETKQNEQYQKETQNQSQNNQVVSQPPISSSAPNDIEVRAVSGIPKFRYESPTDENLKKGFVESYGFEVYAPQNRKITAQEAIKSAFDALPENVRKANDAYAQITGRSFWDEENADYLSWAQNEIDTKGGLRIDRNLDQNDKAVIDSFARGGFEGLKNDIETGKLSGNALADARKAQTDRNINLLTSETSLGKDEFENDIKPRDYQADYERQQNERNNPDYDLRKRAEDNIYNSSLTGGTEAEVLAEMERLKRLELSPETKATLEGIGTIGKNSVGNYFGGNSDITSGIIGAGGGLADLIAGANRPFAALGITDGSAYEAWSKIGQGARVIENSMKNDNIGGDVLNLVGRSAVDIPKYAVMSALPGGAVVGFGLDSGLQTAGRGETVGEVIKQTAKGASLGALFNLSGSVGDKISNVLIKPVAKIGTVGVGTFAVEKGFGASDEQALHSAIINGLFETSHSLGDLRGKFARVWEKGQAREVKIDEKGDVLLLKGLEKSPVDVEMVLDPKDGSYRPKPQNENISRETFPEDRGAIDAEFTESPRNAEVAKNDALAVRENSSGLESLKTSEPVTEIQQRSTAPRSVGEQLDGITAESQPSRESETSRQIVNAYRLIYGLEPYEGDLSGLRGAIAEANQQTAPELYKALDEPKNAADYVRALEYNEKYFEANKDAATVEGFENSPSANVEIFNDGEKISSKPNQNQFAQESPMRVSAIAENATINAGSNAELFSPVKTTLRELDPKRLTKLDEPRADSINNEYEQVKGLAPSKLYKNAVIKYKNGHLFVNAEATEILRRADKLAFLDAESFSYFGRYLNPTNAQTVSRALQRDADGLFFDSYLDDKKASFVAEFEKARKASKLGDIRQVVTSKTAPYGLRAARQEELAHAKDYALGGQHKTAVETFRRDKIGLAAMRTVQKSGYENFSSEGLAREVAAKIWTDTAPEDLKIPADKIKYLRDLYVKSILSKGETFADFENEFRRISKSTRNYLQETKTNYEQRSGNEPVGRTGRTDAGASGNQGFNGKVITEGTREFNGTSARNEGAGRNRVTALAKLRPPERRFIERKSGKDTALAEKVASEILYSRPKANDKMTVGDYVVDIANGIPRALKATLDWSAAGRQGLILSLSNPKAAVKSFRQQAMSFFSAKAHEKFVETLDNHPLIKAMEDTGLYLSNRADKSDLNQREEQFMSRIFGDDKFFSNEKLEAFRQGLTYPIRWSERAFSDYLDKLRVESYMHFAKQVFEYNERKGISDNETYQKQLEGVARAINTFTGRASLGRFEDNAAVLNLPFFSVRNWKSRIDVINPAFYAKLPPGARGAALRSFGTFVGATALAMLLLKKSGIADIETDPDSPDFLKVRIGQYRYDIAAAIPQNLRYVAQMVRGGLQGDASGMAKTTLNYFRGKLAPLPSAIVSMATGTKISGEPTSAKAEASGLVVPISLEQLTSGAKNDGTLGALLSAPDLLGFGVSRFQNSQEVGFQLAELERKLAAAKKDSDEEKELYKQVKLWRDYYNQVRQQPGELPFFASSLSDDDETDEKEKTVVYNDDQTKPATRLDLSQKIGFYKENKNNLFSFAKDQLESIIIQDAENMRVRGRLTKELENRVKEIIPDYEPLRENNPGVDLRPDKPKKLPKITEDLPKLPKRPKLPPIPQSSGVVRLTDGVSGESDNSEPFEIKHNPKWLAGRQSENVIDLREGSPVRDVITAVRYGTVSELDKSFDAVDLADRTKAEREEITKEINDAINEVRWLKLTDKTVEIEPDFIDALRKYRKKTKSYDESSLLSDAADWLLR